MTHLFNLGHEHLLKENKNAKLRILVHIKCIQGPNCQLSVLLMIWAPPGRICVGIALVAGWVVEVGTAFKVETDIG